MVVEEVVVKVDGKVAEKLSLHPEDLDLAAEHHHDQKDPFRIVVGKRRVDPPETVTL